MSDAFFTVEYLTAGYGKATVLHNVSFTLSAGSVTLLTGRNGKVQTRETLLRDVWNYDPTLDTRTVDTTMQRLRAKLGQAAKHLETVRGVGYRYLDPEVCGAS